VVEGIEEFHAELHGGILPLLEPNAKPRLGIDSIASKLGYATAFSDVAPQNIPVAPLTTRAWPSDWSRNPVDVASNLKLRNSCD